jgi:hypothetical protein
MDHDTIAEKPPVAPVTGEEIARFLEIWRILAGHGGDHRGGEPRLAHRKVERWLESLARS